MKILKETGNYLKNRARRYLAFATIGIIGSLIIIYTSIPSLPFYIDAGNYEGARGGFSLIPAIIGILYWRKYKKYKRGYDGEIRVTKHLNSALSDEYYLINDVNLPPYNRGNIDHIVLSPKGIFAIETKNHRGKITCYGDEWLIQYRGKNKGSTEREFNLTLGSPSAQVRNSAFRVKKIIESLEALKSKRAWVQGIVVFSNEHAELYVNEPPDRVDIMTLKDLPNYLRNYSGKQFSLEEMELIGKEILREAQ